MGVNVTGDEFAWVDQVEWGPCPSWCSRHPDPAVGMRDGGHMTDLREDGTAIRIHERRWPLPDRGDPESVQAVELEAIETCTQGRKPQIGEVRFLMNADVGQYMSLAAAASASAIIRSALAEMSVR